MGVVRLSRAARQDLIQIWRYLNANAGSSVATGCINLIRARTIQLAQFPFSGRVRPELATDARSVVVERWLVLYRVEGSDVRLLRVIDGARELSSLKFDED